LTKVKRRIASAAKFGSDVLFAGRASSAKRRMQKFYALLSTF
jgi:hypothetical protein